VLLDFTIEEDCRYPIFEAIDGRRYKIKISEAIGRVSAEFIYLYPPGIPIVVPGEVLTGDLVELIMKFKDLGLPVQGMEDEAAEEIFVLEEM